MRVEQNLTAESPIRPGTFPLGMILVLVWVGSTILSDLPMLDPLLFFLMTPDTVEVFGRILVVLAPWLRLEGRSLLAASMVFLAPVLFGASFYGILMRRRWARALTIGLSAYSFAFLLYGIIKMQELPIVLFRPHRAHDVGYSQIVTQLVSDLLGLGIDAIVAVYLYRKRGFFRT